MNREFKPTSRPLRIAFAAAALMVTVGLGAFIDTLAWHYSVDGVQTAQRPAIVVASGG